MNEDEEEERIQHDLYTKQTEEDLAYWNELADLLGWKVYGFTYKGSASFDTGGMYHSTVQLTGYQRDDIVRAIRNAEETAKKTS